MPTYEYRCLKCGNVFEVRQKFADPILTVHEACGGSVERLISVPGLHFKGTGWYITDYARGGSKKGSEADSSKTGESSKTKSESTSSESKSTESKSTESKATDSKSSDTKTASKSESRPAGGATKND